MGRVFGGKVLAAPSSVASMSLNIPNVEHHLTRSRTSQTPNVNDGQLEPVLVVEKQHQQELLHGDVFPGHILQIFRKCSGKVLEFVRKILEMYLAGIGHRGGQR